MRQNVNNVNNSNNRVGIHQLCCINKLTCNRSASSSTSKSSGSTQLYRPYSPPTLALTLNLRPAGTAGGGVAGGDCWTAGRFLAAWVPWPRVPPMVEVLRPSLASREGAPITEPPALAPAGVRVCAVCAVTASTLNPLVPDSATGRAAASASFAALAAAEQSSRARTAEERWKTTLWAKIFTSEIYIWLINKKESILTNLKPF